MRRYDLVVFDFDGTLADSLGWFRRILPDVEATFGLRPLDPAQFDAHRSMPARALIAKMGVRWWQLPGIARYARRRMSAEAATIALFDGVPAMLSRLRDAGVRLAVVTTNSEANVLRILGDAAACIDHFGCGAAMFGKKRHTRAAMRATGVAPARTLCVGDELRDADAARAVGADFVPVGWGYTLPSAFEAAGHAAPLDTPARIFDRAVAP
ncbi:HAD hydrolase-like protein [Tahibacter soli]|jgi:phosphoglycolate phosphatase|uniref:HAD hydrolase-like protein n=1 Tax=Tahibacter soli TaxID=2983605 RepID=A0A9X4BK34_9GAMM|nr:HAD hydrolase-like protein [Tahibacter soli]MDC8015328.1 HAD hydrolase-like protein [Tahibacter soli]